VTSAAQVFASDRSNRPCAIAGKEQHGQHHVRAAAAKTSQISHAFDVPKTRTKLFPSPNASR
jgi:hypothetical protein